MRNEIISKELLSLVLGREELIPHEISDNLLWYETTVDNVWENNYENLDTLGRLCKEWITKDHHKNFLCNLDIHSTFDTFLVSVTMNFDYDVLDNKKQFYGDSELEAIIKATEWVAKEKGLL